MCKRVSCSVPVRIYKQTEKNKEAKFLDFFYSGG
jgi:hypothetical protein